MIDPNASVFLLKPIAAHMSQIGGVVLDSNSVLELTLDSTTNATLTIDGYISRKMHEGDAVLISRSERCARFLRGSPKSGVLGRVIASIGHAYRGSSSRRGIGQLNNPAPHKLPLKTERLDSKTIFRGEKLTLRVDTLKMGDRPPATKEIIQHPGSSVMLPITDRGTVLLVKTVAGSTGLLHLGVALWHT